MPTPRPTITPASAKIGQWIFKHADQSIEWSPEIYSIFGLQAGELAPSYAAFMDFVHPEDQAAVRQAFENSVASAKPYAIEHRVVLRDGSVKWLAETCLHVQEPNGQISLSVGITVDRSLEHAAERELEASNTLLHSLFANMADGLVLIDIETRQVEATNSAFARLHGATVEAIVGQSVFDLHPESAHDFVSQCFSAHSEAQTTRHNAVPFKSKSGLIWHADIHASLLQLNGRRHMLGIIRDISPEIEDRKRQQMMLSLLETTSEAVIITDATNRILTANRAFQKITGYSATEAVGRNPNFISSGRQPKDFYQTMWRSILEHGSWSGEIWNRRKNGQIYPEWLTISVLRDQQGRIVNHIAVFSDLSRQKQAEADLADLTRKDWLTQLPNRLSFLQSVQDALVQATRHGRSAAILLADIRNFSLINESFGYEIGDEVLITMARRLQECRTHEQIVSRHDSDEFAVLLPDIASAEACSSCIARMRELFEAPLSIAGQEVKLGVSIGVAVFPNDATEPLDLLNAASRALREAANQGGQFFCFYSSSMDRRARRHLQVETKLRSAIASGAISVHYQPQVTMQDGALVGFEALARWTDAELGPISPGEFIGVAVDADLMGAMGEAVLDRVLQDISYWHGRGLKVPPVAVNFTPVELQVAGFGTGILQRLRDANLPSANLELEVTESAILEPNRVTRENIALLRENGIRLAIDDFGTGYSSFAYLRNLMFDKIKIDQSFVHGLGVNPNDEAIVRSLVALARALSIKVLAEGVETREQAQFLLDAGCPLGQGWLYGKAMPADQAISWLATSEA